jgi:CRISPR-associated endonuclease/helicase Cas3
MKDRFAEFFHAIHGKTPFPWQERLVSEVVAKGWPETINLPTASGKTAVMDIAVFALACDPFMPRRIALVVDRRIVVDDAYARARKIRDALKKAEDGILKRVADALKQRGGEEKEPLQAAQLRGGIYREDRWARTPVQPVILCSTVDQVGSRLLFRGYGLSSSMWPIHAGLMGNDSLIILDEAHCSEPFRQTLSWVSKYRNKAEAESRRPFSLVTMTATPRDESVSFMLDDQDRSHEVLRRRINARKQAMLRTCKNIDAEVVNIVTKMAENGQTILVVVNRVQTARSIRNKLSNKKKLCHAVLLTGRCRPVERDTLLEKWRDRIMAGRDRQAFIEDKPLVIVATQCVEVGADLDADLLITECCALDALRQRLGRVDRLGENGESSVFILIDEKQIGEPDAPEDDPIYGPKLSRTWHWLNSRKGDAECLDLGISALEDVPRETAASLCAPSSDAPIIFPAYCDLWSQTGPIPGASPDPAIFLHGPERGTADVSIVWRADLEGDSTTWTDAVSLCPPVTSESLSLPIGIAKKWLAGQKTSGESYGDLEANPDLGVNDSASFRPALQWRGPENSKVCRKPQDIRPGDVLVVPTGYGGCDQEGWNEAYQEEVRDIADQARRLACRPEIVRVHSSLLPEDSPLREFADIPTEGEWPEDLEERAFAAAGVQGNGWKIAPHPGGQGIVLINTRRIWFTDEDTSSNRSSRPVSLLSHLADVESRVGEYCNALGFPEELAHDLKLAARFHDAGKADPRFQAWLAGGSRIRARRNGLLAKSVRLPASRKALSEARKKSGYPEGGRHELLSVRLLESDPNLLASARDPELVLHLIASHHGHCRPFAPVVEDERPLEVALEIYECRFKAGTQTGLERLDSGIADRFWRLIRKYGWWGLAGMEACLRLADHRASEHPREEDAS